MRRVLLILVTCLVCACHRHPDERAKLIEATTHLQAQIHAGMCEASYNAATEGFRKDEDPLDWQRECRALGGWRGFDVVDAQRSANTEPLFLLVVRAHLEKGEQGLAFQWRLDSEGARLDGIEVQIDEQHWRMIPVRMRPGKIIDPPVKRSGESPGP